MAGAPAMVGHDRRGALHDRHPVGIGDPGHQDRAVDEAVDVGRRSRSGRPGPLRWQSPTAKTRDETAALVLQPIGLERAGFPARLHGFRARLHDEQLAGFAVLGPLHVHRLAVMRFDRAGPARQLQDLLVAQHEGRAFGLARLATLRGGAAVRRA